MDIQLREARGVVGKVVPESVSLTNGRIKRWQEGTWRGRVTRLTRGEGGGVQRTVKEKEREAEEDCACWTPIVIGGGGHSQDEVTLKGVNADWAKAHQCAHVRTHSLQRAQTGFTADKGTLL